jgi:PelA/Pel-15E family pectate lyase
MNFCSSGGSLRRGLCAAGWLWAASLCACSESGARARATPAPSGLLPGAPSPSSPGGAGSGPELPSATPAETVTPVGLVNPSAPDSMNPPVAAPGAGGTGAVGMVGRAPVMPPVTVDCSLASSAAAPVQVAWDDVNDQAAAWYATPEALTIAENVLYYQNADRGWPKNIDMTTRTAVRGDESMIDNDATTTQIDFLARVYTATGCSSYGDAARNGIADLLDAQYDNGGWPQRFPNPTGYAAHITYNDNAMVHVLEQLRSVAAQSDRFAFVDAAVASNASAAVERGIGCILATQVVRDGARVGWCAQHDAVPLAPAQARTYELPSLSGSEGAALFTFLMSIDQPSAEVRAAVKGAAAWFEAVQITGVRIQRTTDATQPTGEDRVLVQDAAAPPLWARFYELGTDRPIFSSRCETPECTADPFFQRRYSLAEIENERRVGYAWYGTWPARALSTTYPAWRARWME